MNSLDDWFSHIKQIHTKRIELGLDRVAAVAERLSLRTFSCPVITVAGTNGKGSCSKTLETIYATAGFKTALYTSPHLMHFNERICINQNMISDDDLLRAFQAVDNARFDIILSFFEFTTLAALWLFQAAECDVIILEVGLGGRLDAVNMVESDVAVVTSIALDHMDWLGDDREAIAHEKASIARENKPLICGEEDPPEHIAKTVCEKKAVLHQINQDYFYTVDADHFYYRSSDTVEFTLPMPHLKPQNIATAIAVVECLQSTLPVTKAHIAEGIASTRWPGRFEMISSFVPFVLDVAHNPHASTWLAEQYARLPRVHCTIAIVGMLKDKSIVETVLPLLPHVDIWYVCNLENTSEERGSDGKSLMHFFQEKGMENYHYFPSVSDALFALQGTHLQSKCDRVLVFGSFYTVAAAKQWLNHQH